MELNRIQVIVMVRGGFVMRFTNDTARSSRGVRSFQTRATSNSVASVIPKFRISERISTVTNMFSRLGAQPRGLGSFRGA